MKKEDRKAVHRLLDAVIDKIEESRDSRGYVAFELTSYSFCLRASNNDMRKEGWLMYHDYNNKEDYCNAARSDAMIEELKAVEFSTTKQDADTTNL